MSAIGDKIKQVFGAAAVYKNPANYEVFNGRNLPSFVKDYLISTHIAADGSFKREALSQFLDAHIPKDNSAIRARLRRGETLTLLTRFVVTTSLAQNKTSFQIPDMGIKASDTLIPDYLIEEYPDDLIDGEKWGIMKIVYIQPAEHEAGHVEMVKFKPFRPMQKLDINYIRNCRAQFTLEEWIDVLISAMEYTPSAFKSMTQKLEFLTRLLPFIEPRLNLIELAPKGTGKSYVFGNLSKFVWLVLYGIQLWALLLNNTLGGFVAIFITIIFVSIFAIIRDKKNWIWILLIVGILIGNCIYAEINTSYISSNFNILSHDVTHITDDSAGSNRMVKWKNAFKGI